MNEEGVLLIMLALAFLIYCIGSDLKDRIRELERDNNYLKNRIDTIYNVVNWIYQAVDKEEEKEDEE